MAPNLLNKVLRFLISQGLEIFWRRRDKVVPFILVQNSWAYNLSLALSLNQDQIKIESFQI